MFYHNVRGTKRSLYRKLSREVQLTLPSPTLTKPEVAEAMMDVVVDRSYNLVDLLTDINDDLDINLEIEKYLTKYENDISEVIPDFEDGKKDNCYLMRCLNGR